MDTSDSECFESADESFHSDEEETTVIMNSLKNLEVHEKTDRDKLSESNEKYNNSVPEKRDDKSSESAPEKHSSVTEQKSDTKERECLTAGNIVTDEQEKPNTQTTKTETFTPTNKEDNLWDDDDDWGNFDTTPDATLHDNTQLPSDLQKGKLVSKYVPDEDKWEFDTWEPLTDQKDDVKPSDSGWGNWGNWGVSSILSTATTLTSQVSQGLSTVLESGIGVPDPEELARLNKQAQQQRNDNETVAFNENNNSSMGFGLGNLVSGVSQITKIVETTGNKVISSGLDTLETIGKKTMEVLQEGDPGLKKKRAFLQINQDKPVLSQLLREAKSKAESENKEQKHFVKKPNYETIFDDHQGLVHLEALEMLARQCDIKLQTVLETYSGQTLKETQETMEQVKELCEIPDDEEEEETLTSQEIKRRLETAVHEIDVPITYEKLISSWLETEEWLGKINTVVCGERELHEQAIETLAQLTALAVEQFHKCGELLLIKEHRSTADEADSLVQYVLEISLKGFVKF